MKKNIAVATATRAEFGLLKPLILKLMKEDFCETRVLVTGMHLSEDFGYTCNEIISSGIPIAAKIECVSGEDSPHSISDNMAAALRGFAAYFEQNRPDLLIVLGDRYEMMAVCIAAMNERIPIAHIHGGETTEGAVDEAIRHSITKMSQLHFVSTDVYRRRVIQLGEDPDRVYNVGALAVENVLNTEFISRDELEKEFPVLMRNKYCVVTYHPVTLEDDSGISGFEQMLLALNEFQDMAFIITKANADTGGRTINERIDEYASSHMNVTAVTSLGARKYLSAVKYSAAVIGNSSSGLIEVPCLNIPTVNIGNRQNGRFMPDSVLCCNAVKDDITRAIRKAVTSDLNRDILNGSNPFGKGDTSDKIVKIIRDRFDNYGKISIEKKFYDKEDWDNEKSGGDTGAKRL